MFELDQAEFRFESRIKIIGVGGGGGNAINTMIENGLTGVEFVAANTDMMDLHKSKAKIKLQLGSVATKGLGTGANPDCGEESARESEKEIRALLADANMVMIAAGMGGGTGTGAAPIIASIAKDMGILTLGIVTKPFAFEGMRRRQNAARGISRLREYVDTMIVIPNEKLNEIYSDLMILEAFGKADGVLFEAAKAISDIINKSGYINVDFADVKSVMSNMGYALMGTGIYEGENRAVNAAKASISNPLLADLSLDGCKALLVNVSGGYDLKMSEFEEVLNVITNETGSDANIITGLIMNEDMIGSVRVTIIATGVNSEAEDKDSSMPIVHLKNEDVQRQQLTEMFDRINKAEVINPEAQEPEKSLGPEDLLAEKLDVPSFMRKFSD